MDNSIGVMLTSFKRPHTLRQQLAAIDSQTVKPKDVVIWHNDGGVQPDVEAMRGRKVVALNYNSGVWARFSAALWLLPYEFIVVLDDDTIPGIGWLSWCRYHYSQKAALLGVNGVIFNHGERSQRTYVGLSQENEPRQRVDIVGHGWFINRSILQLACDLSGCVHLNTAGEDYHLAFCAQAHQIDTEVPGHNLRCQLGSCAPELGTDSVSLYRQPGEEQKKQMAHDFYRRKGWKTLYDLKHAHSTA